MRKEDQLLLAAGEGVGERDIVSPRLFYISVPPIESRRSGRTKHAGLERVDRDENNQRASSSLSAISIPYPVGRSPVGRGTLFSWDVRKKYRGGGWIRDDGRRCGVGRGERAGCWWSDVVSRVVGGRFGGWVDVSQGPRGMTKHASCGTSVVGWCGAAGPARPGGRRHLVGLGSGDRWRRAAGGGRKIGCECLPILDGSRAVGQRRRLAVPLPLSCLGLRESRCAQRTREPLAPRATRPLLANNQRQKNEIRLKVQAPATKYSNSNSIQEPLAEHGMQSTIAPPLYDPEPPSTASYTTPAAPRPTPR